MKTKIIFTIFGVLLFGACIWAGIFYWNNLRGIWPVLKGPPDDIVDLLDGKKATSTPGPDQNNTDDLTRPVSINTTGYPLTLPEGFQISIFANELPGARVMKFDALGNMWVSQTSEGSISLLEINDGKVIDQNQIFRNLRNPHGLTFDPDDPSVMYIAEEDKVSRVRIYADGPIEKIVDLPKDDGHNTRTIEFGPDSQLYISIGSSCNVCNERDGRRAKIFIMNRDGNAMTEFARGLRNAVFFDWHPDTDEMWATEMGRDLLGDDIPPDEINIIQKNNNYGWPNCYGKNTHDTDFDPATSLRDNGTGKNRNPCQEPFETSSHINIPAHSAPLGLAFIPSTGWPQEYHGDLLVAYHGSWNRTTPTGYKVVRFELDQNGNNIKVSDFISGWLTSSGALGRPVDILITDDGTMYMSDDKAGVIYKIEYKS